ncbi:MAG: grpE [Thermoleophilia bacterium]|nr:grpE [Thermoleophilia bacterium]
MTDEHAHSRSGPGATTGARAGAHGIQPHAPGPEVRPTDVDPTQPLPLDPTLEYVAKADHEAVVEQLTTEREAMKGDLQRIAADFENYKRRALQAREQASAAAETKLLGELLTVIDDTERAIEHAAKPETAKEAVVDGLGTVRSRIEGIVTSHGLERIDTSGHFDAHLHEAMMVQPTEGVEDGQIIQVFQSGWKLGDRVLRHARVIVAGGE